MTAYQLFDALPAAVEDALRASIRRFGVLVPVVTDQHGTVIDGHHRARIAAELGVDHRTDVVTVADDDEAREVAVTLNADRRQLDAEQRREVVAALRAAGHSYRAIGGALGVDPATAFRDSSGVADATPERRERVVGIDGKSYPASRPAPRTEPEEEAQWSGGGEVGAYDADGEWHDRPADVAREVVEEHREAIHRQPPAARRRPLPDTYRSGVTDLWRSTERLVRLAEDDRYRDNASTVTQMCAPELMRSMTALTGVVGRLDPAAIRSNEEARHWWVAGLDDIGGALDRLRTALHEEQ